MNDDALTNEYFQTMGKLGGDVAGRREAYEYMKGSTAIVHHQVVASSFIPRLFCQDAYDAMKRTAEMTHSICVKVMERYLSDEGYRRLFDFDPRLEELILLPRGYDSVLPFARFDTFLDEKTYEAKFCEFNGDGSAGMNENREITNSVTPSKTFGEFAGEHELAGCSLFEPWVKDFIRIYGTYEHKVDNPRFAICDYLENGVVDEFHVFASLFAKNGYECVVCDVRDLAFDGNELRDADGKRIDAIWRRCVTNDVVDNWDASTALIEAVRQEKVALIGSFAGHIIHDKQIFDVLLENETLEFLTAEEASFLETAIPTTDFLDSAYVNLDQIIANKDEWIIKPADHYGADHVYAGCEVGQQEWKSLIERFADSRDGYPFIVQRYCRPYKTETLPPYDSGRDGKAQYNNLNGLYVYDGRFQGVFSRLGPNPTISKQNEGMTAATIWCDVEPDPRCMLLGEDLYGDGLA